MYVCLWVPVWLCHLCECALCMLLCVYSQAVIYSRTLASKLGLTYPFKFEARCQPGGGVLTCGCVGGWCVWVCVGGYMCAGVCVCVRSLGLLSEVGVRGCCTGVLMY